MLCKKFMVWYGNNFNFENWITIFGKCIHYDMNFMIQTNIVCFLKLIKWEIPKKLCIMLIEYFHIVVNILQQMSNMWAIQLTPHMCIYVCVCVHKLYYSNKFENNANQFQPQIKQ